MRRLATIVASLTVGIAIGLVVPSLAQDSGSHPDDPSAAVPAERAPVMAHRYTLTVFGSAMDYAHAAGTEIVELHFPGHGIVCNIQGAPMQGIQMNAFYGEPRDQLDPRIIDLVGDKAPATPKPEQVDVPAELFDRIKKLADLTHGRGVFAIALRADLAATDLFVSKN